MYRHPEFDDSEMVTCSGSRYLPIGYRLSFNGDGTVNHTAILKDIKADSVVEARLDKVESAIECPTTRVQTAGDAENGEVGKKPDEINDARRAE